MSDQRDIVETLRQWARDFSTDNDREVFVTAANEIAELRSIRDGLNGDVHQIGQERDDLREQLVDARQALMAIRHEMNHPVSESLAIVRAYAMATDAARAITLPDEASK